MLYVLILFVAALLLLFSHDLAVFFSIVSFHIDLMCFFFIKVCTPPIPTPFPRAAFPVWLLLELFSLFCVMLFCVICYVLFCCCFELLLLLDYIFSLVSLFVFCVCFLVYLCLLTSCRGCVVVFICSYKMS